MSAPNRHVLQGDLEGLEFAIANYIARWGQHLDGVHPGSLAGTPVAVANMAMTVIRKNIIGSFTDDSYKVGRQHAEEDIRALATEDTS